MLTNDLRFVNYDFPQVNELRNVTFLIMLSRSGQKMFKIIGEDTHIEYPHLSKIP